MSGSDHKEAATQSMFYSSTTQHSYICSEFFFFFLSLSGHFWFHPGNSEHLERRNPDSSGHWVHREYCRPSEKGWRSHEMRNVFCQVLPRSHMDLNATQWEFKRESFATALSLHYCLDIALIGFAQRNRWHLWTCFRCKLSDKMFSACQALKTHLNDATVLSSKEMVCS